MLKRFKCLFKVHDYDLSDYTVNYINQPDRNGRITNGILMNLMIIRPYVNCKRCNRKVRFKA